MATLSAASACWRSSARAAGAAPMARGAAWFTLAGARRAAGYSARCSNQAKSAVTGAAPASWWA